MLCVVFLGFCLFKMIFHTDVSKNRGGPPKWMVKIMENPIKMDGGTIIFGNPHTTIWKKIFGSLFSKHRTRKSRFWRVPKMTSWIWQT